MACASACLLMATLFMQRYDATQEGLQQQVFHCKNVALGIFGGVALLGGLCRTKPVRDRLHRMRVAFVTWVDAV